jgi:perosamine synthetase
MAVSAPGLIEGFTSYMTFLQSNLIPRYNWDYGVADLMQAFGAAIGVVPAHGERLGQLFDTPPIHTGSGRASLYAILKGLGLEEGSRIGVPLYCCPVVFDAIRQAGMIPEFVDVDPETFNLSSQDLSRKVEDISAVVVVHMFGHPVDMDAIAEVASNAIPIIEDCAQALFSRYKGVYAGLLSDVSFFSFRSGKYLSAGEGSSIFCKRNELHCDISSIVENFNSIGLTREFIHGITTYIKSKCYQKPLYGLVGLPIGKRLDRRMNLTAKSGFELQKASKINLGVVDAKLVDFMNSIERQRQNALYYKANIHTEKIQLPEEKPDCWSNYYQFPIRFPSRETRDQAASFLFEKGIDSAKYLDEVVKLATKEYGYRGDCPQSEHCTDTMLSIPNYYRLSSKDRDRIVDALNELENII